MSKTPHKLTSKKETPRKTFPPVSYVVEKGSGGWAVVEVIRKLDLPRSKRVLAVYGNEQEADAAAWAMYPREDEAEAEDLD